MVHLVTCLAFTILWVIGMRNQPPPVLCTSNGEPQLCTFLKTEPILNSSILVSLNFLLQEVSRWLVTPEVDKPKFHIMCFLFMFVPASWNTKYLFRTLMSNHCIWFPCPHHTSILWLHVVLCSMSILGFQYPLCIWFVCRNTTETMCQPVLTLYHLTHYYYY